jgi:SAM-dependent methyltransferase
MAEKKTKKKATKKKPLTAKSADRHILYQRSVQEPSAELDFIDRVYKLLYDRKAESLREDFCGTALLCAAWVKSRKERTATGVDIDPKVLAWGKEHNLGPLSDEERTRLELLRQDVRDPVRARHQVICAFNFSYWIFRTRDDMRAYFEKVKKGLTKDGVFLLDAYGGWESHQPQIERSKKGGFTYVWDQHKYDPITHSIENHIHFEFPDGTKQHRAFSYYWRFWSLPELTELLTEAGFKDVRVYWDTSRNEAWDDYKPRTRAENQPGWLAYLSAKV